jgi:uncharacterized protein (TIGR00255 family)
MTGYGKHQTIYNDKKISIEIKSLNSKQSDIYSKIPSVYKSHEIPFRNIISKRLFRGKIELNLNVELPTTQQTAQINTNIVQSYLEQLKPLNIEGDLLSTIMRLPEVLVTEKAEIEEKEFAIIEEGIKLACEDLMKYRLTEGERTEIELRNCINHIENLLQSVIPFEGERITTVRERIFSQLEKNIEHQKIDKDRFEQELIYYIEKLDISEEKLRLKSNCDLFIAELDSKNQPKGKKLGFICQEIGREINTLGSKANHAEIQKLVIQMKDELEKIKEQVLNIL